MYVFIRLAETGKRKARIRAGREGWTALKGFEQNKKWGIRHYPKNMACMREARGERSPWPNKAKVPKNSGLLLEI
jgi:hypothetical protein